MDRGDDAVIMEFGGGGDVESALIRQTADSSSQAQRVPKKSKVLRC